MVKKDIYYVRGCPYFDEGFDEIFDKEYLMFY
jgi:hypothetical protein